MELFTYCNNPNCDDGEYCEKCNGVGFVSVMKEEETKELLKSIRRLIDWQGTTAVDDYYRVKKTCDHIQSMLNKIDG